jgi:acyl carrier protein
MRPAERMVTVDEDLVRRQACAAITAMAPGAPPELTDRTRLVSDLGYDSVRLIELTLVLEQRFGLPPVEQSEVATVSTVGDVVALVLDIAGRPT